MRRHHVAKFGLAFLPLLLAAAIALPSAAQTLAKKQSLPGLPNFGRVSDALSRGAQPQDAGYAELKKQGVEIVVSFREHPNQIAAERYAVEAQGMRFVSIPWPPMDAPRSAQVAEFLEILRANRGRKIFVHCQRGAERTGVMVAAYRMAGEKWTPQQALDEMERFGFRGFWFRSFKAYVRKFPAQLDSDPAFKFTVVPAK